jgi:hypothetical protein
VQAADFPIKEARKLQQTSIRSYISALDKAEALFH